MKLSEVDKTYKFVSADECGNLQVFDIQQAPFSIYGVFYEAGQYKRMPKTVAESVSEGVDILHTMTAGGRVKFRTNSQAVALFVEEETYQLPNQALIGSSGFEIFADGKYVKSVFKPLDGKNLVKQKFSSYVRFNTKKWREIEIYFPLYCRVFEVLVGIDEHALCSQSKGYKSGKPIVYYGSSITQGASASKPSTSYQSFIQRWSHRDYINLGFSGNCKGEQTMLDYIASLEMSAFVLDYDYNAETVEHLRATHLNCYQSIREKHPNIPIIMLSRPEANKTAESMERRDIVKATYTYSLNSGDKNTYFIDGHTLFGNKDKDICTIDGCHPTDLGFYRMAKRIYTVLKTAFKNKEEEI